MFKVKFRYVFVLLLGGYSYLNILFTEGHKIFGYDIQGYFLLIIILVVVLLIWEGNRFLESLYLEKAKNQKPTYKPLLVFFGLSIIYICLLAFVTTLAISSFHDTVNQSAFFHFKLSLGFAFRVNLFLHCINAIVFYMDQFKRSQVETETLKKKNLEARFEALRNQINPHFLFNSLNVLSTLVYKDADTSARFIDQLSKVYRYLLYYQEKKIVQLEEEISFINSYIFLLKIRFKENLNFHMEVDPKHNDKYIAPASLQLLIENAIKHNVVSGKKPLNIIITTNKNQIIVENNLQEKDHKEPSSRIGIANIIERYKFISKDLPRIEKSADTFRVSIPLIKLKEI